MEDVAESVQPRVFFLTCTDCFDKGCDCYSYCYCDYHYHMNNDHRELINS